MIRNIVPGLLLVSCGGEPTLQSDAGEAVVDAAVERDSETSDAAAPTPPPGLQRWIIGDPADAIAASRAGLILMGGGVDVDAAFAWQRDRVDGGDVVVLRASGADGYNDYLYGEIGGVDSVETLLVDTRALAEEPYVRWALDHAEAIFIAGGDQAVYWEAWRGTPVATAVGDAWSRGAVVGGTSAGCAVLGEFVYTAANGTIYSDEALVDPYDERLTLERDFVAQPVLAGIVTDTHFAQRDRMGRLVAFAARLIEDGWASRPLGIGIDEETALVLDEVGHAIVLGASSVYVIAPEAAAATCAPGVPLEWSDVPLVELRAGDTIDLPAGTTSAPARVLSASDGALDPKDPY